MFSGGRERVHWEQMGKNSIGFNLGIFQNSSRIFFISLVLGH